MAQSTLSRQVDALERELGAVLFVRGGRGVTLTAAGAAFVPEAELVLAAAARAEAAVRRGSGRPQPRPAPCQVDEGSCTSASPQELASA